jgi:hypothetical protein
MQYVFDYLHKLELGYIVQALGCLQTTVLNRIQSIFHESSQVAKYSIQVGESNKLEANPDQALGCMYHIPI